MNSGIVLNDGTYIDVRQISVVIPSSMDWCKVVLDNGFEFETQNYSLIRRKLDEWNSKGGE